MVPLVLKPKIYSVINRWRSAKSGRGRDAILFLVCIFLMWIIYTGLKLGLRTLTKYGNFAHFDPTYLLQAILITILGLLLISNLVASFGSLFQSRDLDLLLSAPISRTRFFWGKFCDVFASSSWMMIVFGIPLLTAFERFYGLGGDFYVRSIVVLVPFFAVPTAISLVIITLFTSFVPARRTRDLFLFATLLGIVGLFVIYDSLLRSEGHRVNDLSQIFKAMVFIRNVSAPWNPAYLASTYIVGDADTLSKIGGSVLGLIYSYLMGFLALAYMVLGLLHSYAYSYTKSSSQIMKVDSQRGQKFFSAITFFLKPRVQAFIAKGVRVFIRDIAQAVQLIMLLALCMLYLYNFKVLRMVESLPESVQIWWKNVLMIANLAVGAFVVSATATRFVFPSISLEGQSYWLIRSAPVSIRSMLWTKFGMWLLPLGTIGTVLVASGALAVNIDVGHILVNILATWIITFGLAGLAIGFGGMYANFDWENPAHLSASFGGLLYMATSAFLILIDLFPAILLMVLQSFKELGFSLSDQDLQLSLILSLVLLVYLNLKIVTWSIDMAESALTQREG